MAAIPGQPEARPSQVESPVPANGVGFESLNAQAPGPALKGPSGGVGFESIGSGAPAPDAQPQGQGYQGPGSTALQYLPQAMGVAGGIVGMPAGPAGMAAMGAAGYAAGRGYQDLINMNLGNQQQPSSLDSIQEGAGKEGASQLIGLKVGELAGAGASAIAKSEVGQIIGKFAAEPLAFVKNQIQKAGDAIKSPLTQMISSKMTPANTEQAGDYVKNAFATDIGQRFTGFVKAYAGLKSVAAEIPFAPETTAKGLTDGVRTWAADLPGNSSYKMIKGFTDQLDQAPNGAAFYSVLGDIKQAAKQATEDALKYNSNALRDQAAYLTQFSDKASKYMEDGVIGGMARRIANGKGSMPEMQAFEKMMVSQQNPSVAADPKNLAEYTKSVANDYLSQREAVNSAYGKFRGFLSDVGEQTRVNPSSQGPTGFLNDIQDVPSEKLIERMFDPKNAAALRSMKAETPQIYDMVMRTKMNQVAQKATVNGTLDPALFQKTLDALPDSTRSLLITPAEAKVVSSVADNPRLARLSSLEHFGNNWAVNFAANMAEFVRTGAPPVAKAISGNRVMAVPAAQAVGQGAQGLAGMMGGQR